MSRKKSLASFLVLAVIGLTGVLGRAAPASQDDLNAASLPELQSDGGKLDQAIQKAIKRSAVGLSPEQTSEIVGKLRHYLLFLGLTSKDFTKAAKSAVALETPPPESDAAVPVSSAPASPSSAEESEGTDEDADSTPSNLRAIQRLLSASTQFLNCENFVDWSCLEKSPLLRPSAKYRWDSKPDLGQPQPAGESLEIETFFTQAWDGKTPRSGVVDRLAERMHSDAAKSLSMAMYGIDDIEGTMKPVFGQIVDHARNGSTLVRAVTDISGIERGVAPWVLSYQVNASFADRWLFGPGVSGTGMHATFQYDGTPNLIRELNGGIPSDDAARVRVEWPPAHIMHNKFMVLEDDQGRKSVWSGTANLSNHCMGAETNSNMSIYIRNNAIAESFLEEFNHMYQFDSSLKVSSRLVTAQDGSALLRTGRFHHNKVPVSHRYFTFSDGTQVRVHFAPTDDAEHRVILPMLLSARAGDEIRISMFGGTGYEIVRALQYAQSRGANIRIVFDSMLAYGQTSWIRDQVANLFQANPYIERIKNAERGRLFKRKAKNPTTFGTMDVRISTWPGKNHYKVGSLTRKQLDGSLKTEELIVGSQNWSTGGNDSNDENLVSIQNLTREIPAAQAFNSEFDNHLWPAARPERARK